MLPRDVPLNSFPCSLLCIYTTSSQPIDQCTPHTCTLKHMDLETWCCVFEPVERQSNLVFKIVVLEPEQGIPLEFWGVLPEPVLPAGLVVIVK